MRLQPSSLRIPSVSFAICPAVPASLWLALGILLVLCPVLWGTPWPVSMVLTLAATLALALVVQLPERRLVLFFPLGVLLCALHTWAPWQSYRRQLPRETCGAEVRGVVVRADYAGESLAWLRPDPMAMVKLRAWRLGSAEAWQPCSGKVLMRLPAGFDAGYGESIEAEGAFVRPPGPVTRAAFDYRKYLQTSGIHHVFEAVEAHVTVPLRGWRRMPAFLFLFRDWCAERLVLHMDRNDNSRILLAMTLGYRRGLPAQVRTRFIRSGAIHIFAISGLHTTIVGSLLAFFLCLARIPFRTRCLLLPLLLGGYVFMTGAAPSALRAWLMLSLWSVGRAWFRPTVPLNIVATAALVLLIGNPYGLAQSGFQFSFLIVSVLVMGWRMLSQLVAIVEERSLWIPLRVSNRRFARLCRRRCLQLSGGAVLAWLGSAGLVMWTNSLFIPAAIWVNMGISSLAWLTLFLAVPKILTAMLPFAWPAALLNAVFQGLLNSICALVAWGSRPPGSMAVCRPWLGLVLLYYGCLLATLAPRLPGKRRAVAGIAAGVVLMMMAVRSAPDDPRTLLMHGGDTAMPAIALIGRGSAAPIVVNTGGGRAARDMVSWLTAHGFDTIEALILPGGSWGVASGADAILDALAVRTLVVPAGAQWGASLVEAREKQHRRGHRIRFLQSRTLPERRELLLNTATLRFRSRYGGGDLDFELHSDNARHAHSVEVSVSLTGPMSIICRADGQEYARLTSRPMLHREIVLLGEPQARLPIATPVAEPQQQ